MEEGSETCVWKIFTGAGVLLITLILSSVVVCGVNATCRNHIPTVSNMLSSTFAAPYLMGGLVIAFVFHAFIVWCLYHACNTKSYYWSNLQMFSAYLIYFTCIVTLYVLPFTSGWPDNWANVSILAALCFWMVVTIVSIWRGIPLRPIMWNVIMWLIYTSCVIVYIAVRAVSLPMINKDVGLLVSEIIGGLALVGFMVATISHIWDMSIQFNKHSKANSLPLSSKAH